MSMENRKYASLKSQMDDDLCEVEDTEEIFWLRESDDYDSKVKLGNALVGQYRYKDAIEAYQSAMQIRSDDKLLYIRIAGAFLTIGQFNNAYGAYFDAIRHGATEKSIAYYIGIWHYLKEEYSAAAECFLKCMPCDDEMASAAHELRTPIAAMKSRIDVFQMKPEHTPDQYGHLIDTISRNTERLSGLVEQLLDLTNQAAVDMEEHVDLRALAEEAAIDLEPLAAKQNITITVNGHAETTGNDCLLQRALFNLMQNAVKYNLPGGTVTVTLGQHEGRACCRVADTGRGVPKELQPHIFDLFFRVDASRSREIGGNGLGLALVKRIIEQHAGTLKVSDNLPQGLCIEFCI